MIITLWREQIIGKLPKLDSLMLILFAGLAAMTWVIVTA